MDRSRAELSRSKQFPSLGAEAASQQSRAHSTDDAKRGRKVGKDGGAEEEKEAASAPSASPDAHLTVEELMESEFARIIGHESIKAQLRQFHKKVQLDRIRAAHGKDADTKRLYHMIFSGPPGTGQRSHRAAAEYSSAERH